MSTDLREGLSCPKCGLNARQRAILFAVQKLWKSRKFFTPFRIVGISDGQSIESAFASKYTSDYKNFEYHVEPFLDITEVDSQMKSIANLVSCSEVLEHVKPPVKKAFSGLYDLLMPGGWLILSVPHTQSPTMHVEHFPEMLDTELVSGEEFVLKGVDRQGNTREFRNLIFHGGAGATLEYRVFSEDSLRQFLLSAGFVSIRIQRNNRVIGSAWEPWSRVWVARKPFL